MKIGYTGFSDENLPAKDRSVRDLRHVAGHVNAYHFRGSTVLRYKSR